MPNQKDDATMNNAALRIAHDAAEAEPEAETGSALQAHLDRLDQLHMHFREDRDATAKELAELEIDLHQVFASMDNYRASLIRDRLHALKCTLLRTDTIYGLDVTIAQMGRDLRSGRLEA